MPKGFTQQQLRLVAGMVRAAYAGDKKAYHSQADQLRVALVGDRKTALDSGVPRDYFDRAQEGEVTRALQGVFPQKDLVGEYLALHGHVESRISSANGLPNLLHRGAVLERLGETGPAKNAYIEGIHSCVSQLPSQYMIGGETPAGLVLVVNQDKSVIR